VSFPPLCKSKIAEVDALNERLEHWAKDETIDFLYVEGRSTQTGLTNDVIEVSKS